MPPLWPPKRKYNAASAIANEIWQYHTGGSLMVFGKDHDTAEEGWSQVHQKQRFLQPSMWFRYVQLVAIWRAAYRSEIYFFSRGGVEAGHASSCSSSPIWSYSQYLFLTNIVIFALDPGVIEPSFRQHELQTCCRCRRWGSFSSTPLRSSTFANTVLIYSSTTYLDAIFDGGDDESYTMI